MHYFTFDGALREFGCTQVNITNFGFLGSLKELSGKNNVYDHIKIQRNRLRSAQRANEQQAYARLRELVPALKTRRRKTSKLETLKYTCEHIKYLKEILEKLQLIKLERERAKKLEETELEKTKEVDLASDEIEATKVGLV